MRRDEDSQHFEGPVRRWAGNCPGDGLGPQGAALILELQRLRRALEDENPPQPRAAKPRRATLDNADRRPPGRLIEGPPLRVPSPPETGKSVGLWIARCRTGLTAGVDFILGREGWAGREPTDNDTLMSRTGWVYEQELRTGFRFF